METTRIGDTWATTNVGYSALVDADWVSQAWFDKLKTDTFESHVVWLVNSKQQQITKLEVTDTK